MRSPEPRTSVIAAPGGPRIAPPALSDPYPSERDPAIRSVHDAARRGEFRHLVGAGDEDEPEPSLPLRGTSYVPLRWVRASWLDRGEHRSVKRQLPFARRAIQKARDKAGLFADLQEWPTPEERVARIRAVTAEAHRRMRDEHAADLRAMRRRLQRLPAEIRRALLFAWGERKLPCEPTQLGVFIASYLRGDVIPITALKFPTMLLIVGCTAQRDPSPKRMPVGRRFRGPLMEFAASGALLGRSVAHLVITAECGPLLTYEQERDGVHIGSEGPSMTEARAAELSSPEWARTADEHIHGTSFCVGGGRRPPFDVVYIAGSWLHQRVAAAWEDHGVFQDARVMYIPGDEETQMRILCAEFDVRGWGGAPEYAAGAPEAHQHEAPAQLDLPCLGAACGEKS